MSSAPLTRNIGSTERTLQALLHKYLAVEGLSFPQWTALVLLAAGGGTLKPDVLAARIAGGRITGEQEAALLVESMAGQGFLLKSGSGLLVTSPEASAMYKRLRQQVDNATDALFDGLPADDIDTTRRTLDLVADRAARLMAA